MLKKLSLCISGFLSILIITNNVFSLEKTPEAKRAEYLLYIINNVTWSDDYEVFTIGILEKEEYLFTELKNQVSNYSSVIDKNIQVKSYSAIDELTYVQMLYVNRAQGFDISPVLRTIQGKGTLLVSENYEFQSSMINFLVVNNILRFEINLTRIETEGFKIEPLFAAQAVQNRADWSKLYLEAENRLHREQEIVEEQTKIIRTQEKTILEQQSLIYEQEQRLKEQLQLIKERDKEIALQTEKLAILNVALNKTEKEVKSTLEILQKKNLEIEESEKNILKAAKELEQKEFNIQEKEKVIERQDSQILSQLQEIEKQRILIVMGTVLLLALIGLAYFIYRGYRIKRRANMILEKKNAHIKKQNIEIDRQRMIAMNQRDTIGEQKQQIQDSITYASRIQEAVLPPKEILNDHLKNYFLLNKPKEIVSGDYYWMAQKEDNLIIAVADCTGHGVPGAFMSMLGVAFLNEIVNKITDLKGNEILNLLRNYVIKSLHQTGKYTEARDGMDIALCIINSKTYDIQYAGAFNPLYIVRPAKNKVNNTHCENIRLLCENDNYSLYRIKADIMPVAIHRQSNKPFTNHHFRLAKDDILYLFSDGYIDQFGGENRSRYSTRRFNDLILNIQQHQDLQKQYLVLEEEHMRWRKIKDNSEIIQPQLDDILIMGLRL